MIFSTAIFTVDFINRWYSPATAPPWATLTVLCLAVFLINVSTLIVNIALPQVSTEIGASSDDLLWIVDAFNLTFATLVLAFGFLSDRFGRRRTLIAGLALFAAGCFAASQAESPGLLIALRAVTGVAAAMIYPVTLSIIVNVFPGRAQRSRAIAVWGASAGGAIGMGPLIGGLLVQHYWWGSILLFTGAVALVALVGAVLYAPDSRDPDTPALDRVGLLLSATGIGALVFTIIQAPEHGWASASTVAGLVIAVALLAAFVAQEQRCPEPMLELALFRNPRFTAASASVTIAFFAMFGFTFLIVQYFQQLHGYGPFETGWRVLPVAACTLPASALGTLLALKIGNKYVIAAGLTSFAIAFLWIATIRADTSYTVIVGQMVFLGLGFGLSTVPATEAIMGVVSAAKAGVGSAINDATRELGGTLGVAIIGSVALSIYRSNLDDQDLPAATLDRAKSSLTGALGDAAHLTATGRAATGERLAAVTRAGFLDGLHAGCLVAAGVSLAGALLVLRFLPSHPPEADR